METKLSITEMQSEIKRHIYFMLNTIKERLGAKSNTEEDAYKYHFDLIFDELPFFSLYINIKKATYEKLLLISHKAKELNENDYEALKNIGITFDADSINFKPLLSFVSKPVPYCNIDLKALEAYLDEIETSLLFTSPTYAVQALLARFDVDFGRFDKYDDKGRLFLDIFNGAEDELDYLTLEMTKKENFWTSYVASDLTSEDELGEYTCPFGEELGRAYLEAKGVAEFWQHWKNVFCLNGENEDGPVKLDRNLVIDLITDKQYEIICSFLDTVVGILTSPLYEIPEETVVAILKQTLTGIRRITLAKKLDYYTLGENKLFNRGELSRALGCASEKFTKYTALYGDKAFTEEELKNALKKINQPATLFDI
ncbi:MAG: hypothetical protein IJ002_05575 [Clostridia bacterium]|nr:hypothetical protein [Clostridia bacterium]